MWVKQHATNSMLRFKNSRVIGHGLKLHRSGLALTANTQITVQSDGEATVGLGSTVEKTTSVLSGD